MTTNQHVFSLEKKSKCPLCGKGSILKDSDRGEIICSYCGSVIEEGLVDPSPEWRTFSEEEWGVKSRIGSPSFLAIHDRGLSTTIDRGFKDAFGRGFAPSERKRIKIMKIWDKRTQRQPGYVNLWRAFTELDILADKLNVGSAIMERAAYIYRKALKGNLISGRSIIAIIAASLYIACRSAGTPKNLNDIASVSRVSHKDIAKSFRLLLKELNLEVPIADPVKKISGIASKVGVSEKVARRAMEILRKAKDSHISAGKNPQGLAATALYIACTLEGVSITQKEIAVAAGVTEVTIRNRSKGLRELVA
jgi:transcription initiation factor TFIIB